MARAHPRTRDIVDEDWSADDIARLRPTADSVAEFCDGFARKGGIAGRMQLLASGRHALQCLLAGLPVDPVRTDVLMSAFNCPVVPAAVRAAGYRPRFYDFSTPQGQVDWSDVARSIDGRTAAVIVPHFFGAPADAELLRALTRRAGIYVIEDCAHTFGATLRGTAVGNLWDAAIFSFNYGKPISLCGGAVVVLNNEELKRILPPSEHPDMEVERQEIAQYLRSTSAGRRGIAPVPLPLEFARRVLRRTGLLTPVTPRLARGIGPLRAALGTLCLSRWEGTRGRRNANAAWLAARGVPLWHLPQGAEPSWLRLRVTAPGGDSLKTASRYLRLQGFRAGNLNWPRVETEARNCRLALQAAISGIDVPIHQNMDAEGLACVLDALRPMAVPVEPHTDGPV